MAVATISEYAASINTPQMVKAAMLQGGCPVTKNGRQIKYAGGYCVVFPFETPAKKYAVRCWHVNIADIRRRTKLIAEAIQAARLPYFVGFEYVPDGVQTAQGAQDIVVMDWVKAQSLKAYIADHIAQPDKITALANRFKEMVVDLHQHHMAHGDLQHGNIMVKEDGSIVLVDYDSMYVPALAGCSDDIKGLAGYQHPARWENRTLTEKIDYFSELIIYTSLLALAQNPHLWQELNLEDTETLLFSHGDIASKGSSEIFQLLDSQQDLQPLSARIREFLHKDSLDELVPLEQAIVDPKELLTATLSKKWQDNGYRKQIQTQQDYKTLAQHISKHW